MNTLGLSGISFVEFSAQDPLKLENLFLSFALFGCLRLLQAFQPLV